MVDRRIYDDDEPGHPTPFNGHWNDQSSLKIKELYRKKFSAYWSTIEETDWKSVGIPIRMPEL
jgi:hypothetical protein